jgi:nucleoside-diphosphate-sugar epimerase
LRVLVIGAQGVLGSFIARQFREAGWAVTRGGRRPEIAEDFRLVDLDRSETIAEACGEADLVVSTVRHPALPAERAG